MIYKNNMPEYCEMCEHSEDLEDTSNIWCTKHGEEMRFFWKCAEFKHIFSITAKTECKEEDSKHFGKSVTYGTCYNCQLFDNCWEV